MSPRRLFDLRTARCAGRESARLAAMLCLILGCTSLTGHAQGVYKTTGPGGKIIYTDKPVRQPDGRLTPVDAVEYANSGAKFDSTTRWSDPAFRARRSGDASADAALENSRRAAAAAAEDAAKAAAQAYQSRVESSKNKPGIAPVTVAPATPAPVAPAAQASRSEPASPAQTASAARPENDPRLEKAVVEMIAMQHLVEQAILVCTANQPADANRLSAIQVKWRERNNAMLLKHQKLLYGSFTITQIRDMEETATIANRSKLERGNAAVEEVRVKWCAQMTADIGKGVLDPASRPELAAALASAR